MDHKMTPCLWKRISTSSMAFPFVLKVEWQQLQPAVKLHLLPRIHPLTLHRPQEVLLPPLLELRKRKGRK